MPIATSLRLLWLGGLLDCTGRRSWTTDKLFQPTNVTVVAIAGSEFSVYVGNARHSIHYFADEADRFASASFESLLTGSKSLTYPRSTGWLLIRSYYAAFFAVHALMRLHGWACTRLTSAHLKSVNNDVALLIGEAPKITAGLYLIKIANGGRELLCKPLDASLGGTHEALWSLLRGFLDEITTVVLSVQDTEGQRLAEVIEDFFRLVDSFGGPKWFSAVRNRLNYAHEYGAWFPYVKSTSDYDRLQDVLQSWTGSPEHTLVAPGADELVRFSSACAFLVSLCSTTVRDLAYRSKPASPFRRSSGLLL